MIIKSKSGEVVVNSNLIVSYEMRKEEGKYNVYACDESLRDYFLVSYDTQEKALSQLSEIAMNLAHEDNTSIYQIK